MNIKLIREKLDLTQEKFANELGVSRQTVSNWERENFKPTPVIRKIIENYCEKKNIKID
jgi:DNA-binding transcriptional regulator YiaG